MDRLILSLTSMIIGLIIGLGSLYILLKQKPVLDEHGNVTEIDIPIFGKLKSNYPSLAALLIGAFLVFYPLYRFPAPAPATVRRIPVSGKVTLQGIPANGVMVGIVPGNLTPLRSDGSFNVDVLEGEHTYTGVAYYTGANVTDVYLGGVAVEKGQGRFDAVIGGRP